MEIFWRLLFGHLLADFTCQTNYVAAWKRRSLWGLFVHVTTHPVVYIAFTWPYLNDVWMSAGGWRLNGWACLAVIYLTHLFEDQWRVWSVNNNRAPDNFLFYAWDQVIHVVILYAMSPAAGPGFKTKWPLIGCLAVGVTHFTTITVYFVEKDLFGREFPDDLRKYAPMAARLALFASFFLPGLLWLPVVPAVWAAQWLLPRRWPALTPTRTNFVLGNAMALAGGLAGRFFWFHV